MDANHFFTLPNARVSQFIFTAVARKCSNAVLNRDATTKTMVFVLDERHFRDQY